MIVLRFDIFSGNRRKKFNQFLHCITIQITVLSTFLIHVILTFQLVHIKQKDLVVIFPNSKKRTISSSFLKR